MRKESNFYNDVMLQIDDMQYTMKMFVHMLMFLRKKGLLKEFMKEMDDLEEEIIAKAGVSFKEKAKAIIEEFNKLEVKE